MQEINLYICDLIMISKYNIHLFLQWQFLHLEGIIYNIKKLDASVCNSQCAVSLTISIITTSNFEPSICLSLCTSRQGPCIWSQSMTTKPKGFCCLWWSEGNAIAQPRHPAGVGATAPCVVALVHMLTLQHWNLAVELVAPSWTEKLRKDGKDMKGCPHWPCNTTFSQLMLCWYCKVSAICQARKCVLADTYRFFFFSWEGGSQAVQNETLSWAQSEVKN